MRSVPLSRRQVSAGLVTSATVPWTSLLPRSAVAGADGAAATSADPWVKLEALTKEAQNMGLSAPRVSLGAATQTGEFEELAPAIADFMESVEALRSEARAAEPTDIDGILGRASDLLGEVLAQEKSPREAEEGDEGEEGPEMRAAPQIVAPKLEDIADDYRKLFATCTIRPEKRAEVMSYVNRMLDDKARKFYDGVYDETCIPWYFVGAIHGIEAFFDFRKHLHNGDPLGARTKLVPAGRPKEWNPPVDWSISAVDALSIKNYHKETNWELAETLYRWERYNGWRSRLLHSINTPYLWSYSNHYTKGKYYADNKWDPERVSKQPGTAVLLKALIEMGKVPALA